MNLFCGMGRLVREVEVKYTPSGHTVARFTIAIDRPAKGQNGEKRTDFIICECWDKTAEVAANYLKKGSPVAVEGALHIDTTTQEDGTRRHYTKIYVTRINFVPRNNDQAQDQTYEQPQEYAGPDVNDSDDVPFS